VLNSKNSEGISFSGLLNSIDGVIAQEGRLLFLTTNNVLNLDEALLRPGRIDCVHEL
jgi:mitochondrial chaperone BCS1